MNLVDLYRRAPGACAICSTPDASHGVFEVLPEDPGVLHRVHALYICGQCALEMGTKIAPRFEKLLIDRSVAENFGAAYERAEKAEAKVAEYEAILAQIRGLAPQVEVEG